MGEANIILSNGEEFRPIQGYEGLYSITSFGRVWSHEKQRGFIKQDGKFLRYTKDRHGYVYYSICKNSSLKSYRIHRLVAQHYIPNPNNLPEVNHKDGNKQNNFAGTAANNYEDGNLEWCTNRENKNHALRKGLYKYKKSSEFYGVSLHRGCSHKNNPWQVNISDGKKLIHIGFYNTEIEAAKAYNNYVIDNNLNRLLNYVKVEGVTL